MKVCPRCYQLKSKLEWPSGRPSAYCRECSAKISRRLPNKIVVVRIEDDSKPRLGMFSEGYKAKLDFLRKKGCSVYVHPFGTDELYEWRTFRKQPVSRKMLRRHMIDKEKVTWVDVVNKGYLDVLEVLSAE